MLLATMPVFFSTMLIRAACFVFFFRLIIFLYFNFLLFFAYLIFHVFLPESPIVCVCVCVCVFRRLSHLLSDISKAGRQGH